MLKTIVQLVFSVFVFLGWNCLAAELNVWHFSLDEEQSAPIVREFEKNHPNIKIKLQQLSWDFGHDKLVTSLIAGNAPDIFEIGSTWGPQFSQSGVLKDITEDVRSWKDQYVMWEPVMWQERVFGVPWLVGTRFILYNKDLLKKAGLDPNTPPQTWSELLHMAERIDALGPDIHGYGISVAEDFSPWQTFIPYFWNGGSELLSADWKKSAFNTRSTQNTFSFYKELKKHSILNRQEQIDQLFGSGKIGIILSGAWNFKMIAKTNSSLNDGVTTVPTPESHQTPYSFGGGEYLVILNKTKYPKESLEFVKYLASYDVELGLSKSQKNILPSLKTALTDPYFESDPHMKGFAEQMLYTKTPPAHQDWFAMGRILTGLIDQIMLKDAPIESSVEKASNELDNVLNRKIAVGEVSDQNVTIWIIGLIMMMGFGLLFLKKRKTQKSTWLLLAPWLLIFLVFNLYPILYSWIISFAEYNVLTSRFSFHGLSNYWVTLNDPEFLKALGHTLFFAAGTIPFTLGFSILLAVIVNHKLPLRRMFEAGFFLPVVTSIIVIATLFTYFYAENGYLNYFLSTLGFKTPTPSWLINENWALPSIMAMSIWSSSSYYFILFLAALQAIPKDLYEASRLDGANHWQQFIKITLPQLKPMILFVVVINTIYSLQVFPEIFTMTKGGPSRSTTTIVYYLYEKGFSEFQMGLASAIAYLLAILMAGFSYFQIKVLEEKR